MSIKDIRQFCQWVNEGDDSLEECYEMFLERKAVVEAQMAELQQVMDTINYKCWYYETALKAGTEAIHKKKKISIKTPSSLDFEYTWRFFLLYKTMVLLGHIIRILCQQMISTFLKNKKCDNLLT